MDGVLLMTWFKQSPEEGLLVSLVDVSFCGFLPLEITPHNAPSIIDRL